MNATFVTHHETHTYKNPTSNYTVPPARSDSMVKDHAITDTEDDDSDTESDYLSFDESGDENENSQVEKEARERERQLVLEAAGLIVNQNVGPPPVRSRSKRRPPPVAPVRNVSYHKDLPPVPVEEVETTPAIEVSHEEQLDDAFARYEAFKNNQINLNRLSVVSTDSSTLATPHSPTATTFPLSTSASQNGKERDSEGSKYSNFLNFLRSRTPETEVRRVTSGLSTLNISAPIMHSSTSGSNIPGSPQDSPPRSNSPSFGTVRMFFSFPVAGVCSICVQSWASLVDKTALEGIPPGERKRQEVGYVYLGHLMSIDAS